MRKSNSISSLLCAGAAMLLLAACGSQQELPAHQAIADVDHALDTNGAVAKQYAPVQYNAVLGQLNGLRIMFNRKDYDAVIAGAPAVLAAVKALAETGAALKAEAQKSLPAEWATLKESVPALIATVQRRGIMLEKSSKRPEGVDMLNARRYIADADTIWKQAKAAADGGRTESAVLNARKAKERAEVAARAMQMSLPPG
jgi:hypothetical protein